MNTTMKKRKCHCVVRHAVTFEERQKVRNDIEHKLGTIFPLRDRHAQRLLWEYALGPCPFNP